MFTDGLFEDHAYHHKNYKAHKKDNYILQEEILDFMSHYSKSQKKIKHLPESLIKFKQDYQQKDTFQDDISILVMQVKSKN